MHGPIGALSNYQQQNGFANQSYRDHMSENFTEFDRKTYKTDRKMNGLLEEESDDEEDREHMDLYE